MTGGGYGDGDLPAAADSDAEGAGDPALRVVVDYCAACLEHGLGDAWNATAGNIGAQPLVKRAFVHDPGRQSFRPLTTPALYLWRSSIGKAVWIAAGIRVRPSTLTLRWLPFHATNQDKQRRIEPLMNAMASAIDAGIERGRCPAWVQPGDLDPLAATRGSLVAKYVRFWEWELQSVQRGDMDIPVHGADTKRFPYVELQMTFSEELVDNLDAYGETAGVVETIVAPPAPPGAPDPLPLGVGRLV